ncbi:MAG TPA: hypothetical protein VIF15_06305 [Polyangiaceae bacterium]
MSRAARSLALAALGLAGLTGCGHVEIHELVLRTPGAPSPQAEIYFVGRQPERPYYEVALLQGIGFGDDANMQDVTHALAGRAAGLGCDALVRVHVDQGWARAHAFGVCVRWSPVASPAARPPLVPPAAPAPGPAPAPPAQDESL